MAHIDVVITKEQGATRYVLIPRTCRVAYGFGKYEKRPGRTGIALSYTRISVIKLFGKRTVVRLVTAGNEHRATLVLADLVQLPYYSRHPRVDSTVVKLIAVIWINGFSTRVRGPAFVTILCMSIT
jgi:hypothetical protein